MLFSFWIVGRVRALSLYWYVVSDTCSTQPQYHTLLALNLCELLSCFPPSSVAVASLRPKLRI